MKTIFSGLTPLFFVALVGSVAACGSDNTPVPAGTAGASGSGGSGGSSGGGGSAGQDAGSQEAGETHITGSMGDWVVYADALGDAGPNPLTGISGTVDASKTADGKMHLMLMVKGLPANKTYGSHLHKLACDDNKAGGHYQNMPFPADGSATDPTYANDKNEAWLDFTTDATGSGMGETIVDWTPRAGEAKAVMIHIMATAAGGVAGTKLACISVPF